MHDITVNSWIAIAIAAAIILRAAALIRERLIARAITLGVLYGTGRLLPLRFVPIRVTARFLSRRTANVAEELVGRMFAIRPGPPASGAAGQWPIWQRGHVPSYAVCALASHPKRQDVILRAIMAGLQNALIASLSMRKMPQAPRSSAEQGPETDGAILEFDEFWPVVECVEQLAVHVHEQNRSTFSTGVARLAAAGDVTAQVQLAWVVNELLERSGAEQELGRSVACALGKESGAKHAHAALKILAAYKRAKGEPAIADSIDTIDPFIAQKEERFLRDRAHFANGLNEHERTASEKAVRETARDFFVTDDLSRKAVESAAAAIGKVCDTFLAAGRPRSGLEGVAALAAVRLTLRALCHDLQERIKSANDRPDVAAAASLLAQDVCRWLMEGSGQGVSGFIIVESMESIRDHLPSAAVEAMVDFMRRGPSALDPGIAVCISEGIEDELFTERPEDTNEERRRKREKRRQFLRDARFEPTWKGWKSPVAAVASDRDTVGSHAPAASPDDIRRFWEISLPLFRGRNRREIPIWMNLRLALRRARPRRFLTGVVIERELVEASRLSTA